MRDQQDIMRMRREEYWYSARYGRAYAPSQGYLSGKEVCPLASSGTATTGSYGAFLAPLSAGIVSDMDFSRSYLDTNLDPVVGMFAGKAAFDKAGVEGTLADMGLRYYLMNQNITGLDCQICRTYSEILQLPDFRMGWNKDLDRIRTTLEAKITDLEQEKMRERVTAWRDINRARTDLMERLQEYAATQASQTFLGPRGDQNH